MNSPSTARARIEFGDFQTPAPLARAVCWRLWESGIRPRSIVEPACGVGRLLGAAIGRFPDARRIVGLDINGDHVREASGRLSAQTASADVEFLQGDFFATDWDLRLAALAEPILVIGNPPWVTNSALAVLTSGNRPARRRQPGLRGIDAMTGKSNFDISEAMLAVLLRALDGRDAALAMLCKTRVARATLRRAWESGCQLRSASLFRIDAWRHFGAAVDAGLLVCRLRPGESCRECAVYEDLEEPQPSGWTGYADGHLVADARAYGRWRHLAGAASERWRSGIKHDCARVMELRCEDGVWRNGLGDRVDLEEDCLFPLLKGSRLARGVVGPDRWLVVTQHTVGQDTAELRHTAPRTWNYLRRHAGLLDRRASSIYRGRPRFSIFGVGDYSFAPWKVAIAGFARQLKFVKVGCHGGKPVVLDDTSYFLPCESEGQADRRLELLRSLPAQEFYASLVFWDAKRPITTELLQRLDLERLRGGDDAERWSEWEEEEIEGGDLRSVVSAGSETRAERRAQPDPRRA